jgi:type IV secretory pathway VirB3-like protein
MTNARPFSISTLQDLFNDTKNTPNSRCFGPCCRTLNIRESRRTPSPQLWECWASPPHLAKVGLRQLLWLMFCFVFTTILFIIHYPSILPITYHLHASTYLITTNYLSFLSIYLSINLHSYQCWLGTRMDS